MSPLVSDLFSSYLSNSGYGNVDNSYTQRSLGYSYRLDSHLGAGKYWLYSTNDLYAIVDYTAHYEANYTSMISQPDYIALGACISTRTEEWFGYDCKNKEHLCAFVAKEGSSHVSFMENDAISCTGIALTPRYFKNYISQKLPIGYHEFAKIVSQLNKDIPIPSVMCLLKQLRTFSSTPAITDLYYDAKVLEIVALILQWHEKCEKQGAEQPTINDVDTQYITEVASYIKSHYWEGISLLELSGVACMSQNKLSQLFRNIYGVTISEYIQQLRIEKAKELLLQKDFKIREIASYVGYKRHSSFSEMFKQSTGVTPMEFKNSTLL